MGETPISDVFIFTNGMVCCFDEHGHQLPLFNGKLGAVRAKLIEHSDENTLFMISEFKSWQHRITREQFLCFCRAIEPMAAEPVSEIQSGMGCFSK